MSLSFQLVLTAPASLETPLLALVLPADATLTDALAPLDAPLHGALARTLARRDFRGGRDETVLLVGGDAGVQRLLLVGRGSTPLTRTTARRAAAIAARQAAKLGMGTMHLWLPDADAAAIEGLVVGAAAGSWSYPDLQTPPPEKDRRARLTQVGVIGADLPGLQGALNAGVAIAEGQAIAKRLGQMPGNYCTPQTFVDLGQEIAQRHGMTLTVLGRAEMAAAQMGSFLCVAQGTSQEPRLVALEHRGGPADQQPIVLIGKGLCFDTGGISIKPAPEMEWMKFDMMGAAGVMGAMEAIGRLQLPVNVVGIIGSTTNMPSGEAVKPGDVVRASNGKTIEIINTDAEGRLVLADLLVYAKQFNPAVAIDAATLTGAIVIGLGHHAVGVFGPDRAVVDEVLAAGSAAGEPGWPLPMWEEYREQIKSDVADIKNTGGRAAGSITAALFLQEFVDGYPWVHLDVAGTAYSQSDLGWIPKGPTGTPVGTFVEFVRARAGR
ncbi:MAG: leucyl aminopeptidase [Gemmatimonas sp.]|jgi:leucyl aminopeptidase|uniref:leucyl aminopeptidase n=1 Tax=Gemmatimonas sp. TaxID=1962908 RepID=UPI00391EF392|nr:leucyl aminopeptidase [Gemmatimonadota bacterium]